MDKWNSDIAEKMLREMLDYVKPQYPYISGFLVNTSDFIFEERVKMNCFYCGKYNHSWKCPPKLPPFNYQKIFSEFEFAAFVVVEMAFEESNYSEVRNESSVNLHKCLLQMEKYLWLNNNSTALSFIGGSCKLCKNGCGVDKCNNPYQARSPLEATGVNIIKTAQRYNFNIVFPPKDNMIRLGLILW